MLTSFKFFIKSIKKNQHKNIVGNPRLLKKSKKNNIYNTEGYYMCDVSVKNGNAVICNCNVGLSVSNI